MNKYLATVLCVLVLGSAGAGAAYVHSVNSGAVMTRAAQQFLATLTAEQRVTARMRYDAPERVGWHFIPKAHRKGLQVKHMTPPQREAAFQLLRSVVSQAGFDKAKKIMALEAILQHLEQGRPGGAIRDPERYYYTVFGEPGDTGRWGLSIEGHHLSLNFVVEAGQVIASTPTFFAANPTLVQHDVTGAPPKGTRVLAKEEQLAFALLNSLTGPQRQQAVIADQAPKEIRAAGEPQSPPYAKEGVAFGDLTPPQQQTLEELIGEYARNLPEDVAHSRLETLAQRGEGQVYFAWAGADKPGVGHYYRIQGPTFVIELVNTQPDAAGNPASHIHSVWRDPTGDFAIAPGR